MDFNIIHYLIDVIIVASPNFMKFYEISVASDWTHNVYIYTWILFANLSHISSPFIPYAGLGINLKILPYAGGAVIFRTA